MISAASSEKALSAKSKLEVLVVAGLSYSMKSGNVGFVAGLAAAKVDAQPLYLERSDG
jgi:hypothetical protein